jgi:hypothetical protein
MVDFSYYDTLSNLIPGCILLWGLSYFGPAGNGNGLLVFLTGNDIVDGVLLLILAYFVGHILQFLSKLIIEPTIKSIFWEGHFYSEIILLGPKNKIDPELFDRVITYAENELHLPRDKLELLNDEGILTNEVKAKEARKISNLIYRKIDAKTSDTVGTKAQLQNTFYSLFRNFSMCFICILSFNLGAILSGLISLDTHSIVNLILLSFFSVIFLFQARQRAELYVKGLFWSFA